MLTKRPKEKDQEFTQNQKHQSLKILRIIKSFIKDKDHEISKNNTRVRGI